LYYGYRTVFLKQNREKLFVATTKHLCATFRQFFTDFQRIFQLNLRAILAHFQRNFRANFAFFPVIFFRDCFRHPPQNSSGKAHWLSNACNFADAAKEKRVR